MHSVPDKNSKSGVQSSNVPVLNNSSESGFQSSSVPVSSSGSSTSNQVPVVQQNAANLSTPTQYYEYTNNDTVSHSDGQRVPICRIQRVSI